MIPAVLVIAVLAWAASGHGKPLPCEAGLCTADQVAAETVRYAPPVSVDLGPHRDQAPKIARPS